MSIVKYLNRACQIHELIKQQKTGSLREFAKRLKISKSQLYENIQELKSLGAPIEYCRNRKTFYYSEQIVFYAGYKK
jgi:predicted DNA-binding transcriptional regulator YafY